jgi:hypothetical protein
MPQYIRVGRCRVAFHQLGNGPPIVFMHGFGLDHRNGVGAAQMLWLEHPLFQVHLIYSRSQSVVDRDDRQLQRLALAERLSVPVPDPPTLNRVGMLRIPTLAIFRRFDSPDTRALDLRNVVSGAAVCCEHLLRARRGHRRAGQAPGRSRGRTAGRADRGTGIRLGELLDLELDCIWSSASHGSWLKVPLGKLATEPTVPLDEPTLAALGPAWTNCPPPCSPSPGSKTRSPGRSTGNSPPATSPPCSAASAHTSKPTWPRPPDNPDELTASPTSRCLATRPGIDAHRPFYQNFLDLSNI